jgi:poly-gamma-glutamate capsule biosynthesis protein CapA/YwtB (metallophosphatase superfamily)
MSLKKVLMPENAYGIIPLEGDKKKLVNAIHELADFHGFWRHPQEFLMDLKNWTFFSYWIYKTVNPIVHAQKGSGLEKYFHQNRKKPADLLPKGFKAETEQSMSFVGDLMCTKGAENSKDRIYRDVADLIFDADIACANLESTLTQTEHDGFKFPDDGEPPNINLTPAQYEALIQHKGRCYDIVQLANNHILDCGEEGLTTTLSYLKKDNVCSIGTNDRPEAARQGFVFEHKGLKIGWVAFTYSVNWRPFPDGKRYLVNMVPFHIEKDPDTAPIVEQIKWCRAQGCDLVLLCLHWGLEFELFPQPQQLEWAHAFAEAGADVIVSHHAHVIQPMEFYRTRRDPDRFVPIFYSLGNLTPVFSSAVSALSAVARLKVAKGRHNGVQRTYVSDAGMTPTAILSTSDGDNYGLRVLKVSDLCTLKLDNDMSQYVSQITSYADMAIGKSWREK